MAKSVMKFALAVLLAVVAVMIPLLGIPQLGFSGLLNDDDINVSNELAEGQLIRLVLAADSNLGEDVLKNNANQTAEILRKRLSSLGYYESDVALLSHRDVVFTLPFNADVSLVKNKLSATGNFLFKDADSKEILSSVDIERCGVYSQATSSGTVEYYLGFHLSDEAMKRYTEKTTEIATSSDKTIQLFVDSTALSSLKVEEAVTENDFTIGPFGYDDAVWYATMINARPLPQSVAPATYAVEPVLGNGAYRMMFVGALIALIVIAVVAVIFLKLSGLAVALGTVCSLGTALMLNTAFGLGVSLGGVCCLFFTAILTLLVIVYLLFAAKEESSAYAYTCVKNAMKKKAWFFLDVLALPFAISLAMMIYGNVFTQLFANLVFISVVSCGVGLLIALLVISALTDSQRNKSCVFPQ